MKAVSDKCSNRWARASREPKESAVVSIGHEVTVEVGQGLRGQVVYTGKLGECGRSPGERFQGHEVSQQP